MKKFLVLATLSILTLSANTLQLYNTSNLFLIVKVFGADGSDFGATVMAPQSSNDWSDENPGSVGMNDPAATQTPYTVHWYCPDGNDYAICTNVYPGAATYSQQCSGACQCKTSKIDKDALQKQLKPWQFANPPQFPPETDTAEDG